MAELSGIQYLVLQVLSFQPSGYLCSPMASAFIAEGLENPKEVSDVLISLGDLGLVEYYTEAEETTLVRIERDEDGNPVLDNIGRVKLLLDSEGEIQTELRSVTVDSGWIITEAGRGALNEL